MDDFGKGLGIKRFRFATDHLDLVVFALLKCILWTFGDIALSEFFQLTDLFDLIDFVLFSVYFKDRGVSEFELCFIDPSSVFAIF